MLEWFMWLRILPGAMKKLFSGAKSLFLIGVIQNWYYMMTIPAIAAVYALYKALEKAGIIAKFTAIVTNTLNTVQIITTQCFGLIADLGAMMSCISSAGTPLQ